MSVPKTYFRLRIEFYRYNDGSSNNGNFTRVVNFGNADDAIATRDVIRDAIIAGHGRAYIDDDNPDLPDYTGGCCGGYYTSVALFKVEEVETPI